MKTVSPKVKIENKTFGGKFMAMRNMLPDLWRSDRNMWSPMREFGRLQRRFDRMLDELFNDPISSSWSSTRGYMPTSEEEFAPACDIEETDSHYLLSFDLPGVKANEVKIDLKDNQLTLSGERKKERTEETKGRTTHERYYGSFIRTFTLPSNINPEKVEATCENGVLQVAIPKTTASVGKQIPVKEGKLIETKSSKAA